MLTALLRLYLDVVRQPTSGSAIPKEITREPKFAPYFKNCVGALDGTHVKIFVRGEPPTPYRNRKGTLSQNVLAVCGFDTRFTYVLAGWEGSAHDARVLNHAITEGGFHIPPGKYYLGDAGYANRQYLLIPYRGVRYHLREQAQAAQRYV